jgi:hypothetical protein
MVLPPLPPLPPLPHLLPLPPLLPLSRASAPPRAAGSMHSIYNFSFYNFSRGGLGARVLAGRGQARAGERVPRPLAWRRVSD